MTNQEIALAVVTKVTGVPKSKILSRRREFPVLEARQLITLLLSRDGATDGLISLFLKRCRPATLKIRHAANDSLKYSRLFRDKFDKASILYEEQKSLRLSQN